MATERVYGSYRLEQLWKECEGDLVPLNTGPAQYEGMRRAFYVGAAALITLIDEFSEDEDAMAGVERLMEVREEIGRFFQMIQMGAR